MKLKKLFKDIPNIRIIGSKEIEITGVCSHSKLAAPGNLFIARKGLTNDGMLYIPEAIEAGAAAILTDIPNPLIPKAIPQILHHDVSSLEAVIANRYYGSPASELFMAGITGTNGKTTTSFLVKHLLDQLDGPCGLLGTIEYIIGGHRHRATRTTPDAVSVQKMLREMILQDSRSAVMEVTSHALDQRRVECIDFDTAVFTNLTQDHLDYHETMEKYLAAKAKLFKSLDPVKRKKNHPWPKMAIVNADSPFHKKILENCQAETMTYSIEADADLRAEKITLSPMGTQMTLNFQGEKVEMNFPLAGRYNIYNCLAAAAVGLSRRLPLGKIAAALETASSVSGRLEAIPNPLGLKIYVDFAHTEDALLNVFKCLKEFKNERILAVFGCGGNRDAGKRPKMAKICEAYADLSIVTSDNPRNEDPQEIIRQIVQGFSKNTSYIVEADRYAAIEKAIAIATPNDMILIAGKGHEASQIFANKTIEFDDAKAALEICMKKSYSEKANKNN